MQPTVPQPPTRRPETKTETNYGILANRYYMALEAVSVCTSYQDIKAIVRAVLDGDPI